MFQAKYEALGCNNEQSGPSPQPDGTNILAVETNDKQMINHVCNTMPARDKCHEEATQGSRS